MNIEQAFMKMYKGSHVVSMVSNTAYSFKLLEDRVMLCAEGEAVPFTHLTKEELQGDFKEVYIIETKEDFDALDESTKDSLIKSTLEGAYAKHKFDKNVRSV